MKKNKYNKKYFSEDWTDWLKPSKLSRSEKSKIEKGLNSLGSNDLLAAQLQGITPDEYTRNATKAAVDSINKRTQDLWGSDPMKAAQAGLMGMDAQQMHDAMHGPKYNPNGVEDTGFLTRRIGSGIQRKGSDITTMQDSANEVNAKNTINKIKATDAAKNPPVKANANAEPESEPRMNDHLNAKLVDTTIKVDTNDAAKVAGKVTGSTQVASVVTEGPTNADKAVSLAQASGDTKVLDAAKKTQENLATTPKTESSNPQQVVQEAKEKALGPIESLWSRFKNTSFYKTVEGWIKAITDFFGKKIGSSNITYGSAVLWTILAAIAAYIIYKIAKYLYRKFKANKKRKLSEASKTYWYLKNHTNLSEAKCCKIARYVYTR